MSDVCFLKRLLAFLRKQPEGPLSILFRHATHGFVTVRGDRNNIIQRIERKLSNG